MPPWPIWIEIHSRMIDMKREREERDCCCRLTCKRESVKEQDVEVKPHEFSVWWWGNKGRRKEWRSQKWPLEREDLYLLNPVEKRMRSVLALFPFGEGESQVNEAWLESHGMKNKPWEKALEENSFQGFEFKEAIPMMTYSWDLLPDLLAGRGLLKGKAIFILIHTLDLDA